MTYFTANDRCLQDMPSVLCIFEHVINQIKKDLPGLTMLYTRCDNAGCYAGTLASISHQAICANAGIYLKRTDFSESQRNKDQADGNIVVAKSCLKAYANHDGNLINAESTKEAFEQSFGNLSDSKTIVIAVNESNCILQKTKIEGITNYYLVQFNQRCYNIHKSCIETLPVTITQDIDTRIPWLPETFENFRVPIKFGCACEWKNSVEIVKCRSVSYSRIVNTRILGIMTPHPLIQQYLHLRG